MRRSADFERAVRSGVRSGRSALVVHLAAGDAESRVGFVVSKAVGGAVTRNRVRRRLRAIAASRLSQVPSGSLLVVRALPAAASTDFAELDTQLGSALERAAERDAERGGRVTATVVTA